jgi:cytoskeleton protein RodZ
VFEIGNSLREARLRRGVEIVQAEQGTKIRGKYLRALEEERFEQLPAETYIKGFLRTYADYLGLDGQLYVDEYNSRFVTGEDYGVRPRRSTVRPQPRNRRLERNIVLVVLAAITITTVVLISGWIFSGNDNDAKTTKQTHHVVHHHVVAIGPYLQIKAAGAGSYVAVHRGEAGGRILFNGTIRPGHPASFNGKSFWLTVSSPENLVITVGGKRVDLTGLAPKVLTVTPTGWQVG